MSMTSFAQLGFMNGTLANVRGLQIMSTCIYIYTKERTDHRRYKNDKTIEESAGDSLKEACNMAPHCLQHA